MNFSVFFVIYFAVIQITTIYSFKINDNLSKSNVTNNPKSTEKENVENEIKTITDSNITTSNSITQDSEAFIQEYINNEFNENARAEEVNTRVNNINRNPKKYREKKYKTYKKAFTGGCISGKLNADDGNCVSIEDTGIEKSDNETGTEIVTKTEFAYAEYIANDIKYVFKGDECPTGAGKADDGNCVAIEIM